MDLFQGKYWLASNINTQGEMIHDFLTTNTAVTLVVILKTGNNDVGCVLDAMTEDTEFDCNIKLVTKSGPYVYGADPGKPTKSIYVYANLSDEAITIIQTLQPTLAIFV